MSCGGRLRLFFSQLEVGLEKMSSWGRRKGGKHMRRFGKGQKAVEEGWFLLWVGFGVVLQLAGCCCDDHPTTFGTWLCDLLPLMKLIQVFCGKGGAATTTKGGWVLLQHRMNLTTIPRRPGRRPPKRFIGLLTRSPPLHCLKSRTSPLCWRRD